MARYITTAKGKGKIGKTLPKRAFAGRKKNSTVNKPSMRRIARRAGAKRISSFVYDDAKLHLK